VGDILSRTLLLIVGLTETEWLGEGVIEGEGVVVTEGLVEG